MPNKTFSSLAMVESMMNFLIALVAAIWFQTQEGVITLVILFLFQITVFLMSFKGYNRDEGSVFSINGIVISGMVLAGIFSTLLILFPKVF